jgi:hypothetical protein
MAIIITSSKARAIVASHYTSTTTIATNIYGADFTSATMVIATASTITNKIYGSIGQGTEVWMASPISRSSSVGGRNVGEVTCGDECGE